MNEEKIIGWMLNVGELIISVVLDESDTDLTVTASALVGVSGVNNQTNIQFIPIDLISMSPTVGIRNFLVDPNTELKTVLPKSSLLFYNLEIAENFKQNYRTIMGRPQAQAAPAEETIVKLFE